MFFNELELGSKITIAPFSYLVRSVLPRDALMTQ